MTLSIGKYCVGAGFGIRGVGAAVMVVPRRAVVTDVFGRERGLDERRRRAAALIPDWLCFPTSLTLHPTGVARGGAFLPHPLLSGCRSARHRQRWWPCRG